MSTNEIEPSSPKNSLSCATVAAEIAIIFLIFFLHAGWLVPDVNEPHYLAKAKHYWNPDWCSGDFFLETSDTHEVFFWTFGWLSLWLPLSAVAWIGRLVVWSLLAWAWREASRAVIRRPWTAPLTAGLFVALLTGGNLSNEWVVGGVEAKSFSYVFVLLALRQLVLGAWPRIWPLLGVASAFHTVIGGWSVIAAGIAWLLSRRDAVPISRQLPALGFGLLLALPGIIPSLQAITSTDSVELKREASEIYVFTRLPHHLAVHTLEPEQLTGRLFRNGLMLGGMLLLFRFVPWTPELRRLRGFVLATCLFAAVGLVLGIVLIDRPDLSAGILRFYWFRLYDFAMAMGMAIFVLQLAFTWLTEPHPAGRLLLTACVLGILAHLSNAVIGEIEQHCAPANRATQPEEDWIDVCRWVAVSTPQSARFLTPRMAHTFKWYAERAEVVTQKDIPQDVKGIVEWWDRMDRVHRFRFEGERQFRKTLAHQGEPMLRRLGAKYGARYLVTKTGRPLQFKKLYLNASYVVYEIPKQ